MKRMLFAIGAVLALSGVAVADPNDPNFLPPCSQIGFDDFDGTGNFLTRVITPDLSGSTIPGTFPSSRLDVFGIVDRNVNFDFADDSVSIFTPDTFGIIGEDKLDHFFGVEDLTNPDNPAGTGTATWTFDITGATNLTAQIFVGAMGDFEAADSYIITASIDGGPPQVLWQFFALEALMHTYTMDNGINTNTLPDPLGVGDPNDPNNATIIDNCFQWLEAPIAGTGSTLTITLTVGQDGGLEVFAMDNLRICGTAPNLPPTADAGPDQSVIDNDITLDEVVTLDGTGSFDPDGMIVSYEWFEGPTLIATGATPMVTLGLGTHDLTLIVTDDGGKTGTDFVTITVLPGGAPPVADAGADQELTQSGTGVPVTVTLDGSGSFDSDGMIVSYTWIEDGATIGTGVSTTVDLGAGLHTIFLEIQDNAGNVSRDVTFVKVLAPGMFARHDFDANLDATFSQNPLAGTFTSPGDAFEVKQRNVSASIPFAALDDTGSADPNNECVPFPADSTGVVMCAKQDAFFAVVDLRNSSNPLCDSGEATFTFDITGQSGIEVWIDMGASGDFEAPDPNDPNGPICLPDPNQFATTPFDRYDWTYSVDGGAEQPLFTSSVDEAASYTQTFFSGKQVLTNDPMLVNGNQLDNILRTQMASIPETGTTLTLYFRGRGDGGSESYVFDDIILLTPPPAMNPCAVPGGDADVNDDGVVNISDLGIVLTNFGLSGTHGQGDTNGDGLVNISDLGNVLSLFGTSGCIN